MVKIYRGFTYIYECEHVNECACICACTHSCVCVYVRVCAFGDLFPFGGEGMHPLWSLERSCTDTDFFFIPVHGGYWQMSGVRIAFPGSFSGNRLSSPMSALILTRVDSHSYSLLAALFFASRGRRPDTTCTSPR